MLIFNYLKKKTSQQPKSLVWKLINSPVKFLHECFSFQFKSLKMSMENLNTCGAYLLSTFILIKTQKAALHY